MNTFCKSDKPSSGPDISFKVIQYIKVVKFFPYAWRFVS